MFDIVGKRYWFFGLSLLIILPGLFFLIAYGLPLSIDFTGGSLLEIQFNGALPNTEDVRAVYAEFGFDDALVQTSGSDVLFIRSKEMETSEQSDLVREMSARFNTEITVLRFDKVSASIGAEVGRQASIAVAAAAVLIMAYITYAFNRVPNAFRYGVSAIIAMLHDILVVVGIEAILGKVVGWEADALFLTALLTVIGFSVHDSIVVFDRIRENANIYRRIPYDKLVNHSIVQTMARSINTQLTVLLTLLALALLGGSTIRHFVVILLVGVFSGTYSSIFNAASILVVWENQEWKTWFGRGGSKTAQA